MCECFFLNRCSVFISFLINQKNLEVIADNPFECRKKYYQKIATNLTKILGNNVKSRKTFKKMTFNIRVFLEFPINLKQFVRTP